MKTIVSALLSTLLLANATISHAAETGELWETQVRITVAGQQPFTSEKQRICQSPANREQVVMSQTEASCAKEEMRKTAQGWRWQANCPDLKGSGEIRMIGNDRIEGRIETTTPAAKSVMTFTGTRVGACKLDYASK